MRIKTFFDKCFVIGLDRRPDRIAHFYNDLPNPWPFCRINYNGAIDGGACQPPPHWTEGCGAWGCYRSHCRILEDAINNGWDNVLIFEDDAIFEKDFEQKASTFLENLPDDWDMLYLGGQHLSKVNGAPITINQHVIRAYNINRTHAYAINKKAFQSLYKHLYSNNWTTKQHIDHWYGAYHKDHIIYSPSQWIVGQRDGWSDIAFTEVKNRYWQESIPQLASDTPIVVVLGTHSSGTSCMAGVLYHLGAHMGNKLVGYYGDDPNGKCGFEPIGLMRLCESKIKIPATSYDKRGGPSNVLSSWLKQKQKEAKAKNTVAGCKYPTMAPLLLPIMEKIKSNLYIINAVRPIEDAIQSLHKRFPSNSKEEIEAHQKWLDNTKNQIINHMDEDRVLNIPYYEMLDNPAFWVGKMVDFVPWAKHPNIQQKEKAISFISPKECHIRGNCYE